MRPARGATGAGRGWAIAPPMMAPAVEPLVNFLRGVPLSAPQRPYLANLSGDWVDAAT